MKKRSHFRPERFRQTCSHLEQNASRRVRFNSSEIQQHHKVRSKKKELRKRERSGSSENSAIKMSPKSPKLFVGASPNSPYDSSRRKSPGKRLEDIPERRDDGAAAFDAMMQAEEEVKFFEEASPRDLGLLDLAMEDKDIDDEDVSLLTKDLDIFDDLLGNLEVLKQTEEISSSFDALDILHDESQDGRFRNS